MIELVLAVLAVYRVAAMLATEEGAFGVFVKLRERIDPQQSTWVGRGLNCPLCIGFWVALGATVILAPQTWQVFLMTWGGIAGGAALLQKLADKWDSL